MRTSHAAAGGARSVRRAVVVLLAAASALAPLQVLHTKDARAASSIMFGAYASPHGGESLQTATTNMENAIGRPLAGIRVYDLWNQQFPDSYTNWLKNTGHSIFLSVKSKNLNGTLITWRSVADSQPGSTIYNQIVGWANAVKSYGAHMYFTYNHEPEAGASSKLGTNTDFIDAWRKVVTVFRDQGVTNADFVWIMTDYSFWVTDQRRASIWYPGDDYVDDIAADAYNWYSCRPGIDNPWKSLQQVIDPLRKFGLAHPDKGLMLTEFSSTEDTTGRKATWLQQAQALFQQPGWQQFTALLWFDHIDSNYPNCRWYYNSSPETQTAFTTFANDPYYGGTGTPLPPPPTPTADIFADDFETGGLTAWTGSRNTVVQSADVHGGSFAARATSTGASGAYLSKTFSSAHAEAYAETAFKVLSQGNNYANLIKLTTPSGGSIATVAMTPSGQLLVRNDQTGKTTASGTAPTRNVWHTLQFHVVVNGTSSAVDVSLDGATVPSLSFTTSLGTTGVGRMTVGDTNTGRSFSTEFDDVGVGTQSQV